MSVLGYRYCGNTHRDSRYVLRRTDSHPGQDEAHWRLWLADKLIGRPQPGTRPELTTEYLEKEGMVGVYVPLRTLGEMHEMMRSEHPDLVLKTSQVNIYEGQPFYHGKGSHTLEMVGGLMRFVPDPEAIK